MRDRYHRLINVTTILHEHVRDSCWKSNIFRSRVDSRFAFLVAVTKGEEILEIIAKLDLVPDVTLREVSKCRVSDCVKEFELKR